jgi:hypothetical protein
MINTKYKILTSLSLLLGFSFLSLLPTMMFTIVLFSLIVVMASYYVSNNFHIDYKYWLSFAGQLMGLILVVGCFVAMISLASNLLVQ